MGTNYYHVEKNCEHCGHRELRHIGKSSMGWTFSFQGYSDSPEIKSYKQWLERLLQGGTIEDEYGETVPLNEFQLMVEQKRNAKKCHATYCLEGHSPYYHPTPEQEWLDQDGHSFSLGDFS